MAAYDDVEMSHPGDFPSTIHEQPSISPFSNSRCCFCFPCFNPRRSSAGPPWWERFRYAPAGHAHDDRWWSRGVRAFKKIREWSEIVAGPKWKTFIRRFNRNKSAGNGRLGRFQYDPLSYALNFDEGHNHSGESNEEDDIGGFRDFSSRYASVSASGKPLAMDATGNRDVSAIA